ncbi:TPA: helix-turn-helix domain-containing protein, partial [Pseudomonas aeruginosa]
MGKNLPIGERLSDERKRLGYNQSDFSALAGITRKTLFGYESGERAPDALALAAWAKSGLDVLYVVTGQRQGVPAPAPAQEQEAP